MTGTVKDYIATLAVDRQPAIRKIRAALRKRLASQKSHIALYHMGLYSDPALLTWFRAEYKKRDIGKLDMGISCIRFKKPEIIPVALIGELATRMTPKQWISIYQKSIAKK